MVDNARYIQRSDGTILDRQPTQPAMQELVDRALDHAARLDMRLECFEDISRAGAMLVILGTSLEAIGRFRMRPETEALGEAQREVRLLNARLKKRKGIK